MSSYFWKGSVFFMPKRSVFLSLTVYRNLGMFLGVTILGYWIIVHLLVYQLINSWGAETCALIIEFSLLKYELKFSSKSSFELCFRVCSASKTVLFVSDLTSALMQNTTVENLEIFRIKSIPGLKIPRWCGKLIFTGPDRSLFRLLTSGRQLRIIHGHKFFSAS